MDCINTFGAYRCQCINSSYELNAVGDKCEGEESFKESVKNNNENTQLNGYQRMKINTSKKVLASFKSHDISETTLYRVD